MDYENGGFRVWRVLQCGALFRRAQNVVMPAQKECTTGCRHNVAHVSGSKKVFWYRKRSPKGFAVPRNTKLFEFVLTGYAERPEQDEQAKSAGYPSG
jgi:hypothetical protein